MRVFQIVPARILEIRGSTNGETGRDRNGVTMARTHMAISRPEPCEGIRQTYAKHRFADFIDRKTRRPFTRQAWWDFIERAERRKHGVDPTNLTVITRADEIMAVQRAIPRRVWVALLKRYTLEPDELRTNQRIYLIKR